MSMTTELAQRMKAAALKAKHAGEAPVMHFDERISALKEFQLTACPANVVDLVEALEAKDKRNTELEDLLEAEIKSWMQRYDSANNRREAAEKRIAELEQKADIYDMLREDYEIKGSLVDFVDWQSKRIAELEARDIQPLGVQLITEAIGAHAYIVGCLQQNRPDLALEESLKWVQGISQAAVMATEGE